MTNSINMGVFGAKISPTIYYSDIVDGIVQLKDIGDKRRELLNIKKKPGITKPTLK